HPSTLSLIELFFSCGDASWSYPAVSFGCDTEIHVARANAVETGLSGAARSRSKILRHHRLHANGLDGTPNCRTFGGEVLHYRADENRRFCHVTSLLQLCRACLTMKRLTRIWVRCCPASLVWVIGWN